MKHPGPIMTSMAGITVWWGSRISHTWWHLSALPALCEGNPPDTLHFSHKGPVIQGFDVSMLLAWTNHWTNSLVAGDLRCLIKASPEIKNYSLPHGCLGPETWSLWVTEHWKSDRSPFLSFDGYMPEEVVISESLHLWLCHQHQVNSFDSFTHISWSCFISV